MRRFFIDTPSLDIGEIVLPVEESRHAARVLRMVEGDQLEIINGTGVVFIGEITLSEPKNVIVKRIDYQQSERDPYHIHIAIAPTKSNDRFEWFLEKATELGIHEITPILCANSERKKIKLERYQKILVAATKQSKRLFIPKLNDLTAFEQFIKQTPNGLIAHCYEEEEKNTTIFEQLKENKSRWINGNTSILIGPEGDFSLNEVKNAITNGFQAVTLGQTRLRTETAGVYACMNMKLFFEKKA